MTTGGPRRLKDDPDFRWELGCDLADEQHVVGGYDLSASRQRLMAAIAAEGLSTESTPAPTAAAPPRVGVGLRWAAGLSGSALVVAGAYWLGAMSGGSEAPPPTPPPPAVFERAISAPAELTLPSEEPEAFEDAGVSDELSAVRPGRAAPAAITTEPASESAAVTLVEEALTEAPGTAEAPTNDAAGPVSKPIASGVPAESRAHESAWDDLREGRFGEARAAYDALRIWPGGRLHREAEIGLLRALHGLGDAEATVVQARRIQDLPELSGVRHEIVRLRAESLVLLGRCDEALPLAEELPDRTSTELRKICRTQGRKSP